MIDLRTPELSKARLRVEVFLSARDCEQPLKPGQRIKVLIDLPKGIDTVERCPITFGVPFPAGVLWSTDILRLVDSQSQEVPSQKEAVGLWAPEGAIKWVRFDALVSSRRGCFVEFSRPTRSVPPEQRITVRKQAETIVVDTGVARFVLAKGASPIREVWFQGRCVAKASSRGLYVVDQLNRVAVASPDGETMQIEATGPVTASVRFEGFYTTASGEPLARHITRVECFAGQPFANITHTLVLTRDTNEVWFRDIGLEFEVDVEDSPTAVFASDLHDWRKTLAVELAEGTGGAYMLQDQHYRFAHGKNHFAIAKLHSNRKPSITHEGEECGDWAALVADRSTLMLLCRDTARQHPKEFELRPTRFVLHLLSNRSGEELDFRTPTLVKKWDLLNWYRHALPYRYRDEAEKIAEKVKRLTSNAAGWAKTHSLLLMPARGRCPVKRIARFARLHSSPVFALADPEWICSSGAMRWIHKRDPQRFPLAEKLIDKWLDAWRSLTDLWGGVWIRRLLRRSPSGVSGQIRPTVLLQPLHLHSAT